MRYVKFLLSALVLLAGLQTGHARNLSQLRNDTRFLVRDSSGTRVRYNDATVNALLNEGNRLYIARSWCIEKSTSFPLQANTTYYNLRNDFLSIRRITRDDIQIQEMTPAALDGRSRGWEQASGLPVYYFLNFSSRNVVGFSPWPTSSDTATIKMDYFAMPTDMTNETDSPFDGIPELVAYDHGLTYYSAGILETLEGKTAQAGLFLGQSEAILKRMMDSCKDRPNYLPSIVGRP